jgi:hypothetical protein
VESFDQTRATLREWTVAMDGRELATLREVAMARAPLRRTADSILPEGGYVRGQDKTATGRAGSGPRSRPGKRW